MLKRKDDIRRRLTIAEVPKPPVDLVQKIKHDIPKHYTSRTSKQVERRSRESIPLWNFWGFSWQLAAAVLVLVGLTWAVFEAWRSEVIQTSQVAESSAVTDRDATKSVAPPPPPPAATEARPDGGRFGYNEAPEAETSVDDVRQASGERGQAMNQTVAAAPLASPAKPQHLDYAPEPAAQAAGRDKKFADEMKRSEQPTPAAMAKTASTESDAGKLESAGTAVEGGVEGGVIGGVVGGVITQAPAAPMVVAEEIKDAPKTRAAGESAPSPSALAVRTTSEKEDQLAPAREVTVNGLAADRIVKVELQLDASGKVIEAKVVGKEVRVVIDAVKKASGDWVFPVETGEKGKQSLTRTIDVQLRRQN